MKLIYHGDCLDLLERRQAFDCIIADPPDNLGLGYEGFKDKNDHYYDWLARRVRAMMDCSPIVWLSYYWKHDVEIKHIIWYLLKVCPSWEAKTFIWRFTFGQHNEHDAGSGFRFILRLRKSYIKWSPPSRVRSIRQDMGDSRANPEGRVPDDVWEVPRVTGNSAERRGWHPTQHPVEVYGRMIDGSRVAAQPPARVLDCFGGTGTIFRLLTEATLCEISPDYVAAILKEHPTSRLVEL